MLVSITERCRMNCSHCMSDAKPDSDKIMSREMFEKAVDFNFKYDPTIGITGGEPTEHPEFWDFMDILVNKIEKGWGGIGGAGITVFTNGMNITDDDCKKMYWLNKECKRKKTLLQWQVSAVKPYYPLDIDMGQKWLRLDEVICDTELAVLTPIGRAAQHKDWSFTSKAPQCFNFRSIIRGSGNPQSYSSFHATILTMRSKGYFCTPQIAFDGSIKVGESTLCPAVAHIDDDVKEIERKIREFKCDGSIGCDALLAKMPEQYRKAIGEV